jgi:hypothetical protein
MALPNAYCLDGVLPHRNSSGQRHVVRHNILQACSDVESRHYQIRQRNIFGDLIVFDSTLNIILWT